jgi:hypothetical protein
MFGTGTSRPPTETDADRRRREEETARREKSRAKLVDELGRADKAIQKAMTHADDIFRAPGYRGPDRRRMPR